MNKKIAIYCCGYLRGFRKSLLQLKELVIDRYDCDLYFYLVTDEYSTDKYINSKYNLDDLLQQCKPKFYILENNQYYHDPIQRIKQMWFKLYTCDKLRADFEVKEQFRYDCIIRIRPDLQLKCSKQDIDYYISQSMYNNKIIVPKVPNISYPGLELDTCNYTEHLNDQFAVGPPSVMQVYCQLYSHLQEYQRLGMFNSTSSLWYHLTVQKINVEVVDCPSCLLLRENQLITIAGDSGSGKSNFALSLNQYIHVAHNEDEIIKFDCDRYDKSARGDANWKTYTHLDPEANDITQMKNDILQLKSNHMIKQKDYDHDTGKFTALQSIKPAQLIIVLGLHALIDSTLNQLSDCKIYIEPDHQLKCAWKIQRDQKERGYSVEQTMKNIESRKADFEAYIEPQKENADIIVQYAMCKDGNDLNVILKLRQSLYFSLNIKAKLHVLEQEMNLTKAEIGQWIYVRPADNSDCQSMNWCFKIIYTVLVNK